jgi:nucleoside-diphosphate-sugar epimerase
VANEPVVVTGGCGFIGGHLVDKLVQRGRTVLVIDNTSGPRAYYNKSPLVTYVHKNIVNFNAHDIDKLLLYAPSTIYHLAAHPGVQQSIADPKAAHTNNINSLLVMLDIARQIPRVVFNFASSSSVKPCSSTQNETSPYALSKYIGELLCHQYAKLYKTDVRILRFFNVYGPRQPLRPGLSPLIANYTYKTQKNEPLPIYGSGSSSREYTHVEDLCDAIIALNTYRHHPEWHLTYEISSKKSYTVYQVAEMFQPGGKHQFLPFLYGDVLRSESTLCYPLEKSGWKPKHSLPDYVASLNLNHFVVPPLTEEMQQLTSKALAAIEERNKTPDTPESIREWAERLAADTAGHGDEAEYGEKPQRVRPPEDTQE